VTCVRVVVMGAGGYVGSRLVPALLEAGHEVVATFTDVASASRFWWADQVVAVPMQVLDRESVRAATVGAHVVVYLVHGLGGEDFSTADRQGAYNAAHAAVRAGAGRIVYLGGLVPSIPDGELSTHLRSRLEVEQILTDSGIPTISLRAAMVIGSGSTSFEIMRQLSERMPVQALPTWMSSLVEPVAITDVVTALVGAVDGDGPSRSFELGSGERLGYAALLRLYADRAGLRRVQVRVPLLPTALVARIAPALTTAPSATVRTLVESLRHDMVCSDQDFLDSLMPPLHATVPLQEAIDRALVVPDARTPDQGRDLVGPLTSDAGWAGGQVSRLDGRPVHHRRGEWSDLLLGPSPRPE
jgi:uncharacterized protein YbjT (DUF2867 family)